MSENSGAGRRRRPKRRALDTRGRSLLAVAIGVGGLLILNGLVHQTSVGASGHFIGSPALPVVQMARPSDWRCPGPLPVGAGKVSSRILIVNSASYAVTVTVTVSRATMTLGAVSATSSVTALRRKVFADSQAVVELSRRGPAGFAAVSVESDRGGIGVSEAVEGVANATGDVLPSSPCTLGAAQNGYIPAGSTAGSSSVTVSLFDPLATPAVVNVSVSNGSSVLSPPAFQGLVVPASGLVVLDLRRWVFQVSSLGLDANAVSGSVVVGALEHTSQIVEIASTTTARHHATRANLVGTSLLVGPNKALRRWSFTALQSPTGVSSTFSVYDPSNAPVSVSVAPPGPSGKVAALTQEVQPGSIVDFATPIAPGTRLGAKSVEISAEGGGVVVARLTTRQRSSVLEEINSTAGSAGPKDNWLVPGAMVNRYINDMVTLENPGSRTVSVTLTGLTYGPSKKLHLETVEVLAGTARSVDLGAKVKSLGFALEVTATAPILVEQQLRPRLGQTTAVGGIPILP